MKSFLQEAKKKGDTFYQLREQTGSDFTALNAALLNQQGKKNVSSPANDEGAEWEKRLAIQQ